MENKKPQKIIIFSTAYFPLVGGAEVAVKEITDRIEGEFILITARIRKDLPKREKIGKVEVFRVGWGSNFDKYLLPFLGTFKALRVIRASGEKRALIWAIMASYGGLGALFLKVLRPKWPFLLTLQEGDSEVHILKRVGFFYPVWKMIFKKADYVQVISNYLKDFALKYGVRGPVEIVPNGINFNKLRVKSLKSKVREDLGIKDGEKVILTVSRLVEKNGVDVLIEAMKDVKGKLVIVGEGKERKALELKVKSLKLENNVIFVGEVKPKEVIDYYSKADVFCRPSRSEGFGNVFIEAMAMGVPVVATDVGGIKDFLEDGKNGLKCEVDNSESVAEKINRILEDNNLVDRLIEGGRETVKKYDWEIITEKMKGVFEKVGQKGCLSQRDEAGAIKKILITTPIYPPEPGGPATYSKGLKRELEERGIEVSVISYGERKKDPPVGEAGKGVRFVSRKIPKGLRHIVYFLKTLKEARKADWIYTLDATAAGLPTVIASFIWRKRFLIRVGGDLLWERAAEDGSFKGPMEEFYGEGRYRVYKNWIYKVIKYVLNRAEVVIVPGDNLAKIYEKFYGVEEGKIRVIKNVFVKEDEKEEKISKTPMVLFAGRLIKYKNLERLIRAVKDLELELVIVGEGEEKLNIKNQISKLGLEDKIKVLGGVDREEVKRLIGESWMGISVAWTEFNPNFILECLAQEKPVVISRNNSLSVDLPEEFLCDPMNEEEIKEKIKGVIENYRKSKEKTKEMKLDYDWAQSVKELMKVLGCSDQSRSAQVFK